MNTEVLWNELSGDPLERGYSAMTDAEAAADLNTEYRTRNLDSVTGDECFSATDPTEFGALTDHKQDVWVSFCGRDSIDPFGAANVAFVQWVFGQGSDTLAALAGIRTEAQSRADELGLGYVKPGHVENARLVYGG